MPDLLIELLSEEIPARMQEFAANELKKNMLSFLADQGVSEIAATAYSTPRRLTLFMSGLPEKAPDISEERKGPRIDAPQQAVDGFLRSVDLNLDQLEVKRDGNVDKYFASIEKPGRICTQIVAEALEKTIRTFPWPKSMRWGASSLKWVRPLKGILCIFIRDDQHQLIELELSLIHI